MRHEVSRALRKARAGKVLGLANDLTRLVAMYGDTDKGEHGYLPYYERHFGALRSRSLTVYEIGVGGYGSTAANGSLAIWRDYFFRSQIVGIDIEEKIFNFGPRVRFERADQSSVRDLGAVVARHGAPDVVVDDGSHIGRHLTESFRYLWPLMSSGSVYAIEDLSTSYYPDWEGGDPPPETTAVGLARELVDSVQGLDPVFAYRPELGSRAAPRFPSVGALHVYPGIIFMEKA